MSPHAILWTWVTLGLLTSASDAHAANVKVVVADATYVMADGDTLAVAEEKVLIRAKRRAVEEAGVYLEASSLDVEKQVNGRTSQMNSYEVRTIAAAITETEIVEFHRSFDGDRPVFVVKIRAAVNLDKLEEAIQRHKSEQQLAQHYRQLQKENAELKNLLGELRRNPAGGSAIQIEPTPTSHNRNRAQTLVQTAIATHNLREKIDLASEALAADSRTMDAYIVRGQAYLRLVSAKFSQRTGLRSLLPYLDKARADFDQALMLDTHNTWALLGRADSATWYNNLERATADYEQILTIDPLFDIARERLITIYTTQARKQFTAKHWTQALTTLEKLLDAQTAESWAPYQKGAYLLRSEIHTVLHHFQPAIDDLSTVVRIDPGHAEAFFRRAHLYKKLLQGRLAKDDFERACALGLSMACEELP